MDPITAGVVIALGEYGMDKATEVVPSVLGRLFKFVMDRLTKKGTDEAVIAQNFEKDPETFEKPFAKILDKEIQSDPDFAKAIQELVDEYNKEVEAQNKGDEYKIKVGGDFKSTGSVFGSGKIHTGGDIIGGDKGIKS